MADALRLVMAMTRLGRVVVLLAAGVMIGALAVELKDRVALGWLGGEHAQTTWNCLSSGP